MKRRSVGSEISDSELRGETSIHMESPRPKRLSRPPTQGDSPEPTDYVILERTHSAEIANHTFDVQTRLVFGTNHRTIRVYTNTTHANRDRNCKMHSQLESLR